MNRNIIHASILNATLAFTLFAELYLRKYLFKHHSYLLAGSLPNFLASIVMSFIYITVNNAAQDKTIIKAIIALVSGLVLYEFIQLLMPRMVLDIKDILPPFLAASYLMHLFTSLAKFQRSVPVNIINLSLSQTLPKTCRHVLLSG